MIWCGMICGKKDMVWYDMVWDKSADNNRQCVAFFTSIWDKKGGIAIKLCDKRYGMV